MRFQIKLILVFICLNGLFTDLMAQIIFEKEFGQSFKLEETNLITTYNNSIILAGFSSLETEGDYDILLVKLDSAANLVWRKTFGAAENERLYQIRPVNDGYLIVGEVVISSEEGTDILVMKIDFEGNVLWERQYDYSIFDRGTDILQLADGSYLLFGISYEGEQHNSDWRLIKTDINGAILWSTTYGGVGPDRTTFVKKIQNGFLLGGYFNGYSKVVKVDNNGQEIWNYGNGLDLFGYHDRMYRAVLELSDGTILLGGYGTDVTKLSADGNFIYETGPDYPLGFTAVLKELSLVAPDRVQAVFTRQNSTIGAFTFNSQSGVEMEEVQISEAPFRPQFLGVHYNDDRLFVTGNYFDSLNGFSFVDRGYKAIVYDSTFVADESYVSTHDINIASENTVRVLESIHSEYWLLGVRFSNNNLLSQEILLTKTDEDGNIRSKFSFDKGNNAIPLDLFYTEEDKLLMLVKNNNDFLELSAVDTTGEILWQEYFNGFSNQDSGYPASLIRKKNDGNFLLTISGNRFVTFSEQGEIISDIEGEVNGEGLMRDILINSDGFYKVLTDRNLIVFNADGTYEDFIPINSFDYDDSDFESVEITTDGTMWFYGTARQPGISGKIRMLVKINNQGTRALEMNLGPDNGLVEYSSIHSLSDGSILIAGSFRRLSIYNPEHYLPDVPRFLDLKEYGYFLEWRSSNGNLIERKEWQGAIGVNDFTKLSDNKLLGTGRIFTKNSWDEYLVKSDIDFFVSTDELTQANNFYSQVVPNPGNASLVYMMESPEAGSFSLQISNLAGQVVHQQLGDISEGPQTINIDTHSWPSGIYMVKAQLNGHQVAIDKWVKQ